MSESPHIPFLKAILKTPQDRSPRLIYADWLDEQGDADSAKGWRRLPDLECTVAACVLLGRLGAFRDKGDELLQETQQLPQEA